MIALALRRSAAALLLVACGGGGTGPTADVRERLASTESREAREAAPDLVAEVERALAEADTAERVGERDAAADHVTRARLLLDSAQAEAVRIAEEQERRRVEARVAEILTLARRDERAREAIGAELARLASTRTAREEAERARTAAQTDEARPLRRARVSLEEAQDMRRATSALRARARLLAAAAEALGADTEALRPVLDALAASEQARADPLAALGAADRAHHASQRALGAARRALGGPGPDALSALAEAARAEGFEVMSLPEGLGLEAAGLFAGSSLARGASPRVRSLADLIAAHPHGPVQLHVQVPAGGAGGERLATQRAEVLRRALVEAGVDPGRLRAGGLSPALAAETPLERARVVFVGYAARP